MILEELIEEIGSFGHFQIMLCGLGLLPKLFMGWSMVMPSFAGVTPDWWCVPRGLDGNISNLDNSTYKMCVLNGTTCSRQYSDNMKTVISEWDLVCDFKWVSKTIMSLQMAGLLVGVIAAGQIADTFGRKKIYFYSIGIHSVLNIICAFSVSWEMYAVLRFLIGCMGGLVLGTNFPYIIEFIGNRWRPILTAIPMWPIGVALLALFAWLMPNWSYLHITCGITSAPCLIGWFFMPESPRWLVVKGRIEEAEAVIDLIVRYNEKPKPVDTKKRLQQVAEEEKIESGKNKKYSYHDVFRGWSMLRTTLCSCFVWFSCSVVYYGMTFGVQSLSGNLYLNIFLMTVVEVPSFIVTFWLARKLGRKWTVVGFLLIAGVAMLGTLGTKLAGDQTSKGAILISLALVAKMGLGAGWMVMYLLTNEIYPTVIRSLGFGTSQTLARIGGIIAPMILLINEDNIIVPYVIMGGLLILSSVCVILLRETKGEAMADTLADVEKNKNKKIMCSQRERNEIQTSE